MLTSCPDLVGRLVFKVSSTCCSWSPAYSTTSTQSSTRSSTPFSPGSTNTLVETFHVHHSDSLRRFRRGFSDIYTKCWNSQVQPWQRWGCTRINVMRHFVHRKFWSPIRKQGHRNPPWNDMWQKIVTLPKAQRTRELSSYHKFQTNLDQTLIAESQLSINFKISTKHHHLD